MRSQPVKSVSFDHVGSKNNIPLFHPHSRPWHLKVNLKIEESEEASQFRSICKRRERKGQTGGKEGTGESEIERMEVKEAGTCLDSLVSSFNARIVELQELVIARNMYPATAITDLTAVDTAVKTLEYQMQAIKDRLRQEAEAIPRARKLIDQSLHQQRKLRHMLSHMPSCLLESTGTLNRNPSCALPEPSNHHDIPSLSSKVEESAAPRKEKKGHASSPRWYITVEDIDSLSSYMRGRLTLEKVNAAINEMAMYADANAQLISAPKKKLSEDTWERALELRDIAMAEPVKGKHFFLDSDMKGSALKLDNTGKAILTILRHLGRVHETRIGQNRVFTLSKPQ